MNALVMHSPEGEGAESTDASITFHVPGAAGKPPTKMSLDFRTELLSTPGSITILARTKQSSSDDAIDGLHTRVLRARTLAAGGLPGEESVTVLEAKKGGGGVLGAEWGTPGVAKDAYAPQTEMKLTEDTPEGSVDTAAALQSWDAIRS